MEKEYVKAMAKSYSNQEEGVTIPVEQLEGIVHLSLGFQPSGIVSQSWGDVDRIDRIAIAAYFEPAVCLVRVRRDEKGLHFAVNWIRGVNHGIQSVRLFPDFLRGDANRAQTVNFGPDGTLWVSRNADRTFFILSPPTDPKGRWTLTGKVTLPGEGMVHSALLDEGILTTIESILDLEEWEIAEYEYKIEENKFYSLSKNRVDQYLYGVAKWQGENWFVTDYRYKKPQRNGIYKQFSLVVPDIYGDGICFLSDGSALVTRYGQASPGCFNGEPGALIYVPAHMFK